MGFSRLACVALAAALTCSCTNGSTQPTVCGTFSTSLSVKDRMSQAAAVFNTNEAITFELAITNTANAPATLTASSSCTAVVFEVQDSAQRRLWGSADGIACIQMLQPRTYAPFETVNVPAAWDQRSSGAAVPPGRYGVTADVGQYVSDSGSLTDCHAELSKSATFRIQ